MFLLHPFHQEEYLNFLCSWRLKNTDSCGWDWISTRKKPPGHKLHGVTENGKKCCRRTILPEPMSSAKRIRKFGVPSLTARAGSEKTTTKTRPSKAIHLGAMIRPWADAPPSEFSTKISSEKGNFSAVGIRVKMSRIGLLSSPPVPRGPNEGEDADCGAIATLLGLSDHVTDMPDRKTTWLAECKAKHWLSKQAFTWFSICWLSHINVVTLSVFLGADDFPDAGCFSRC